MTAQSTKVNGKTTNSTVLAHLSSETETEWAGHTFSGNFKDGTYHGYGVYTFPDGEKYVGDYKEGKKHGFGPIHLPMAKNTSAPLPMTNITGRGI